MVPVKCVGGWVGGVGGLFAVCPRSGHTANSLPCVFCLTHGKRSVCHVLENLHTAKVWTYGKLAVSRSDANPLDSLLFSIWFQGYP